MLGNKAFQPVVVGCGIRATARLRLVVKQDDFRQVDVAQARKMRAQAKFGVVAHDPIRFVEYSYRINDIAADGETCPGYGRYVARNPGRNKHAAIVLHANAAIDVARAPTVADHNARMLNRFILE